MEALPFHERVILVGHSYGGYAISQAMEYFPGKISVVVFATAYMPGPTLNYSTLNQMVLLATFFQMIFFLFFLFFFNDKVQYNIIRSNRSKCKPITRETIEFSGGPRHLSTILLKNSTCLKLLSQ